MKLAKLLQQIEKRKKHLVKVLPDFNTATRYTIPETFTLNRERFMFEYFLVELTAIKPLETSEEQAIGKAQLGIRRMLLHMYELHADLILVEIPNLDEMKIYLKKAAPRFFVDAAASNDFDLLEAARNMGADVNGQYCKESAIGEAVKNRHYKMVRHLIAAGANVDIADGIVAKRTALDYAEKNSDFEMAHILQQAGAVQQFHIITRQESKQPAVEIEPPMPTVDGKALDNILAFTAEVERIISDLRNQSHQRVFGGAAENKANNLASALQRARAVPVFDSVKAFAKYKATGKSSIEDALGLSIKMFGRAAAQQEAKNLIAKYSI